MRTRLPTVNVTSCYECPFAVEAYGFSSAHTTAVCCFPTGIGNFDFDDGLSVAENFRDKDMPDWCPGKKYDIALEFPDE